MTNHYISLINNLLLTSIFLLSTSHVLAQDEYPYPPLSPKGTVTQTVGNTEIHIAYERPSARQRQIFGSLVPWNAVWRTGAGHCTKISFNKPTVVGGQPIESGTYALFSIPNPDEWIFILNKDTSLYGSYDYQSQLDVARFVVIPQQSVRYYETLTLDIELFSNNARIYLSWADTQLYFDVKTTTDEVMEDFIEAELNSGKSDNSDWYEGAAEFFYHGRSNYASAIAFTEKALELDEDNGWARHLKIRIYERLQLYDLALQEIEVAIEHIQNRTYELEQHRTNDIEMLSKHAEAIRNKIKK